MNLFELFAKLSLDTSEYEGGLDKAKGLASSIGGGIGSALGTAAKVGGAALAAASAATMAFAGDAISVGQQFDASMSQVAATMGYSVDEINTEGSEAAKTFEQLRSFAQQMGAETAFSASQSADALNFLALAGYDAETSISMLPNVLNLAAAGGIELAEASDMVTDASSALGLDLDETSELIDKMAKASSKSNTSVAQLGSAILTVGGTAKVLSGGTTELSQTLGLLADNGVKGAEGGTALRNIILSLTAPTDKAAKALADLGVSALDNEGKMRSMQDIFADLNVALGDMTEGQKTEVLSSIFNKVDLKSVNALMGTNTERWEELSTAIDDAQGAAQKMADTQLDNLNGDIQIFQSALEGVKIAVSDELTPSIREFVQLGTSGLSDLATAIKEDGLQGAMEALGPFIDNAISMLMEGLPKVIEFGAQLLIAIVSGLIDNLPKLAEGAVQLVQTLGEQLAKAGPGLLEKGAEFVAFVVNGVMEGLPKLLEAATGLLVKFGEYLREKLPELIPAAAEMIVKLADYLTEPSTLAGIVRAAGDIIAGLIQGIVKSIPKLALFAPTVIANLAVGLVGAIPTIIDVGVQLILGLIQGMGEMISAIVLFVPRIVSALIDAFKNLLGIHSPSTVFADMGKAIIQGLINGISSLAGSAVNTVKKIGTSLINGVRNIPSQFITIGKNIITGLKNGLTSMASGAISKVREIAGSLASAAREKLGEHSPSKVFANIGENMALGLGEGWEDEYDKIRRTVTEGLSFAPATAPTLATVGAYGGGTAAYAAPEQPIQITLQSVLDGRIVAQSVTRYQSRDRRARG